MISVRATPGSKAVAWSMIIGVLLVTTSCTGGHRRSAVAVPAPTTTVVALTGATPGISARSAGSRDLVTVQVVAPPGASDMQLGFDPGFVGLRWRAVTSAVDLVAADSGYQTVYARFRGSDGRAMGGILMSSLVIDPEGSAATASTLGQHRVSEAGLAAPDVISLMIESGRIVGGRSERYDVTAAVHGDVIRDGDAGRKIVVRDGRPWAEQQAHGSAWVRVYDTVAGRPLDPTPLDDPKRFVISSTADPNYRAGLAAASVSRITRPSGLAHTSDGDLMTTTNQLFIRLPKPIVEQDTYTVEVPGGDVEPVSFTFTENVSRSPSVHVDQVGFAPGDPLKVAYLSAWTGAAGGLTFDDHPVFSIVDYDTAAVVMQGTGSRRLVPADGEWHHGDLTGAPVTELDFSSLRAEGRYRVCVAHVGCSAPFRIDASATWMHVTVQVARAMFQQRSGVELASENTTATRPRVFHPADGSVVNESTLSILEAGGPSQGDRYDKLSKAGVGPPVADAWGGHFDAGDWDRHIDHLLYLRSAIDLVELYPEQFAHLELDIPESGDSVPDLIDEGLWDLDFFMRMQRPDGGVRGGVEYAGDPPDRTSSWSVSGQQAWAYAPDARSSYVFAGVAAQAATVLAQYDPARADRYSSASKRAFDWAEAHRTEVPAESAQAVSDQRLVALAARYRLTGAADDQRAFLEGAPWTTGPVDLLGCSDSSVCDAAWIYARTSRDDVDASVKANVIESFRRNADSLMALQDTSAFGWTLEHPYVPLVWGLGPSTAKTTGLLRAYALTHDERYRAGAIRAEAFSLGANPIDTVMMTGIGERPVRNPLIIDVTNGGMPVWPGTPVYGVHQLSGADWWVDQYFLKPSGTTPAGTSVPYLWKWFDLPNVAMFNEFTVYQSHAVALFGLGSLAAAAASH